MEAAAPDTPTVNGETTLAASTSRRLLVLATLPAIIREDGHWLLPAKLVSGMSAYAKRWPGPVILGLQAGQHPSSDLDNAYWDPATLPFQLQRHVFKDLVQQGHPVLARSLVLTVLHHELYGLAAQCRRVGAALVVNTELTLKTQLQIARNTRGSGLSLLRSWVWLLLNHRRAVREISLAHGLQCNGTPTFDAFASRNRSSLLYFDSRTTTDLLANAQHLQDKAGWRAGSKSLRLLFSGRLHPIKGAHQLVPMANQLKKLGMDFHLSIAGDGPLREEIEQQIRTHGLESQVHCLGTLHFETELMPLVRRDIDLFVCPHLQGDPSCSYLETLSGGVPIVGYGNEAWLGLHRLCGAGVVSAINDPNALAQAVAALAGDPARLQDLCEKALAFAEQHTFEREFDARMEHLKQVAQRELA